MKDYRRKIYSDLTVVKNPNEYGKALAACHCGKSKCRKLVPVKIDSLEKGVVATCSDLTLSNKPKKIAKIEPGKSTGIDLQYISTHNSMASEGVRMNMTKKEYSKLSHSDCQFCGAAPTRHPTFNTITNYVGRIDKNKTFQRDNVVVSCPDCRTSRGSKSIEGWMAHIARIVSYTSLQPTLDTVERKHVIRRKKVDSE